QVIFAAPDLGLETPVDVRFHPPWRFLVIAGVLGLLGVAVARRKKLLEQKKLALAFELLTAVAGGLLLYVAFLTEWLPTPGLLLGELPAAAVGILGGYLGEGVFQLVSRRLRIPGENG
ncbi:MAG: hypothetical protein MI919_16360, partial [Holophagales bacterium]|nr:hypothetical protein [Holophagales bacterium]